MRKTRNTSTKIAAVVLSALLVCPNAWTASIDIPLKPSIDKLIDEPYLVLLEGTHTFKFSEKELRGFRKQVKQDKKAREKKLKEETKALKKELETLRNELEDLNQRGSQDTHTISFVRHDLHCQIEQVDEKLSQKETERKHGVPVAFDNKISKLDLLEQWPAQRELILQTLRLGTAREQRHGNIEDIGIRVVQEGQEKDIQMGKNAINEMKAHGMMAPETKNEVVKDYVQALAQKIADHSDLKVPLQVTVLDSEEINAFALPGGFLFVNTGLIQKAETESELVGVLAHEIAHVTTRHGARLMRKASIIGIIYQAAQVASVILTGGVAGIGTYYALQYGFMGLGMALDLTLLGVSRDYEGEADQLGAQYSWAADYDSKGFISFFDKMASQKGYVRSASFFRTHPAFYDRIVSTFSEIEYLPRKEDLIVDSTEFKLVKEELKQQVIRRQPNNIKRPTLRRGPDCEPVEID